MSAGDFFDEPSKSGDPELNKLEERIRKNKLSVAGTKKFAFRVEQGNAFCLRWGEDVFMSNISGEFSGFHLFSGKYICFCWDDSEGENVYQNLYLEAKEEAGKLSAELKNLNLVCFQCKKVFFFSLSLQISPR